MESSAPGKSNMWGGKHDTASAIADQTKEIAPCGGKKWKALGLAEVPAEYGGKQFILTPLKFQEISSKIDKILNLPTEQQKNLFEKFLSLNVIEAKKVLDSQSP